MVLGSNIKKIKTHLFLCHQGQSRIRNLEVFAETHMFDSTDQRDIGQTI